MTFDIQHQIVVCDKCGSGWQLLDWSCALHRLTCGDVRVPQSERERLTKLAQQHGKTVIFDVR